VAARMPEPDALLWAGVSGGVDYMFCGFGKERKMG
jgi:hypothetical protein